MKNADCPAFPCQFSGMEAHGLTKREWYAGMAMQGMLSSAEINRHVIKAVEHDHNLLLPLISSLSWQMADAMLAQEEK